ncbi:MAG: SGNH/GDSL hydrolase family protein [Pirellulales bacterium]
MKLKVLLTAILACVTLTANAADKESLPKVLMIGDSISIGYQKPLVALMKDQAVVTHNPGNAAHSANGLANIDKWLGDTKWDVIHFNHGLHDLKYVDKTGKNSTSKETGHIQIPIAEYEKNMNAIVVRLKKTGAKLIFATTTPYPDIPGGPLREAKQAAIYNKAALKVMKKHDVAINNLHDFVLPQLEKLQRPMNVHFSAEGSAALAKEVAKHIQKALAE